MTGVFHDREQRQRGRVSTVEFDGLSVERSGALGLTGLLPRDPDFPTEYNDAITGKLQPLEDTPSSRAIYAAAKLFTDDARRTSFLWRVENGMPIKTVPSTPSGATMRARRWTLPCWKRWQSCACNPRLTKKD